MSKARMATLLGRALYTDNQELIEFLQPSKDPRKESGDRSVDFDALFPGVLSCAVNAIKSMEKARIQVGSLVYINGRMQAWPLENYDQEPSQIFVNQALFVGK